MIPIDLSKQQALDTDLRTIQQINFTANLDCANNLFHSWRSKGNCPGLFTRNCKNIVNMLGNNLVFINITWLNTIV